MRHNDGFARDPRHGNPCLPSDRNLVQRVACLYGASPLVFRGERMSKTDSNFAFVGLWMVVLGRNIPETLYGPDGECGWCAKAPRQRAREAIRRLRAAYYIR